MAPTTPAAGFSSFCDFQDVIDYFDNKLDLTLGEATRDAIRRADQKLIDESVQQCVGPSSGVAKKEAVLAGRTDILEQLLEVDGHIEEGLMVLACERRDYASIRTLLKFGWDLNRSFRGAASSLCTAIDDIAFTRWLIDNGADVNARSPDLDESTLSLAISSGSWDVVQFLLKSGTDITHGDVLHCAAKRPNQQEGAEIVQQLVRMGANVNVYNDPVAFRFRGLTILRTPLHIACERGNIPVAIALLQHGTDPDQMLLEAGALRRPTPMDIVLDVDDQALIAALQECKSRL